MPWGDVLPERYRRFLEAVEGHATRLVPGRAVSSPGIGRWKLDLHKNREEYAEFLRAVFPEMPSSVVHVVMCRVEESRISEFKSLLHSGVEEILDSLSHRHTLHSELDSWTVLTSFDPVIHDPYAHGRLQVCEEWPVALVMKFKSEHGLKLWHEQLEHAEVRRTVWEFLCPETKKVYKQIDDLGTYFKTDVEKAKLFAEIQALASSCFVRFEFREVLDYEEIAGIRVPPPQVWIIPDHAVVHNGS